MVGMKGSSGLNRIKKFFSMSARMAAFLSAPLRGKFVFYGFAAMLLGLGLLFWVFVWPRFAGNSDSAGNILRMEATNHLRALSNEDVPAFIEDLGHLPHVWSMRQFTHGGIVNPVFVNVFQFVADSQRLARIGDGKNDGQSRRVLVPLLAQDGASPPGIYAALPAEDADMLDTEGRPVRWRLPQNILEAYSIFRPAPKAARKKEMQEPDMAFARLPTSVKAVKYRELVSNFASHYNLSPDLVMAIIHSESDFSPALVSNKSAMGLMQLLPSTASDEVHRFLYGRRGSVSFEQLRVPEINIRYGTAYLHILFNRYFSNVRDPEVREYCAIASYNMGPNRFIRLYGPTREEAMANINSMSSEAFYKDLFSRLPARETRFFVQKVRHRKQQYTSRD